MARKPIAGNNYGAGLDKNPQNINRAGRPLSFKRQYMEIYRKAEGVVWVEKDKCRFEVREVRDSSGQEKSVEMVGLQLTKAEQILVKLDRLIMSSRNEKTALDAIKFIWEQVDGRATQSIEYTNTDTPQYDLSRLTDKELKTWTRLLQKVTITTE